MIRVLFMIAIAGFVLSVATLSAAVAIGGPEAVANGGWKVLSGRWDDWDADVRWDWDNDSDWGARHHRAELGPQGTRTLAWSGAERLGIDLPADVRYVQQAGPAAVIVTGPQRAIDEVVVRGDSIRYEHHGAHWRPKLSIVVRAPNISQFEVSGDNRLAIEGYRQDSLRLHVSGVAEVSADGEADTLDLDMSGKAEADLADLKAKGAKVDLSGATEATIAPTDWAKLDISGAGDVRLLTNPRQLETDVSGAGRVRHSEPSARPSPSPVPSPSPSPSPKSDKL
ncbi:DUF2807 domain-containing protein [Phenylobacterium sp.]|uniref:GIN domain-containing protein n=1 Tax=Phenylobacterium sp. TaxID=1871053 RepID=UPI0025E0E563|nr:DUF2807 domain-containing protein [Phenylobacterium sp.]